jgi:aminopeptidase-like protein
VTRGPGESAPLGRLRSADACQGLVADAWALMEELYPLCRSITGEGVRATLAAVGRHIPLELTEVPSGTRVFDWQVPREWNVRAAWIKDATGRTVVDLRDHTLHLVSYSTPLRGWFTLDELRPHLHSLPEHPDWVPYRTSYYRDDWGFCLPHRQLERLAEGRYEVCIDGTLAAGSLSYAECRIAGTSADEFLLFTHVCHPSLCNDNLTGIALATIVARELAHERPRLNYRFVFAPGTIGSITWLARNEAALGRVRHGLVVGLVGDRGPLTYKRSRRGTADIDRIGALVLGRLDAAARCVDFSPYGYDERQLCSPGFDLPVGRLTRSPNGAYPEYHSSADDFSLLDRAAFRQSLRACATMLALADRNAVYVNLNPKCEPQLGRRGLFRATGGAPPADFEHALLWVLNQSDGQHSLLDIAERSGLEFDILCDAADALLAAGLLKAVDAPRSAAEST